MKISCKFVTSLDIFSHKGNTFSRKCDCIGRNFEPCCITSTECFHTFAQDCNNSFITVKKIFMP